MKKIHGFAILALLTATVLIGCSSSSGSQDDLPAVSKVQVLNSSADKDYATTGGFKVALLALDASQNSIVSSDLEVSGSATPRAAIALTTSNIETKTPADSSLPWSVAIDIDSSGSMSSTDPTRLRVTAAKSYADLILQANAKSQLAVYDFGSGNTSGFVATRLLQDYTADKTLLAAGIDQCTDNGDTPLYESIYELLGNVNAKINNNNFQRAIMLLSDGGDNASSHTGTETYALATKYGIPINTVALGYDSDVLKELAANTNGVYAKAESAADLTTMFQSVALGSTQGYVIVSLNFPKNAIPVDESDITLSVTSGGVTKETTFTFTPYAY